MPDYQFPTEQPVDLYVEIGKGNVHVVCTEARETTVEVTGKDAEQVRVDHSGDTISVVAPKLRTGFLGGDSALRVEVVVPTESRLVVRTGSADIQIEGAAGSCQLRSGSGDVRADSLEGTSTIETGSGDVRIGATLAAVKVKSGSGDIVVGQAEAQVAVSTGSGDIELETTSGPAVVKTGSGDLRVGEAGADVSMATGSGDLVIQTTRRGRVTAKGASGDVQVGIPAGTPVWTDISTLSGSIRSDLSGAGEPQDGRDHVELRAKTVSGDIVLTER